MLDKFFLFILIILSMFSALNSEIIKVKQLQKKKENFKIIRDLFNPKRTPKEVVKIRNLEKRERLEIKEEKLKRKHEEVFDKIIYEGFVLKQNNKVALLSINGEFITAKVDEIILDKIKIINISSEHLTIKMENKKYDINLKEDEDEEK